MVLLPDLKHAVFYRPRRKLFVEFASDDMEIHAICHKDRETTAKAVKQCY
jgi:hypothetical protein